MFVIIDGVNNLIYSNLKKLLFYRDKGGQWRHTENLSQILKYLFFMQYLTCSFLLITTSNNYLYFIHISTPQAMPTVFRFRTTVNCNFHSSIGLLYENYFYLLSVLRIDDISITTQLEQTELDNIYFSTKNILSEINLSPFY